MLNKELIYLKGEAKGRGFFNLLKAINVATIFHGGQKRRTGEDYIFHPVRVASELLALNIKDDLILSVAILHDILEDCNITKSQLIHDYKIDPEIVRNVELLTKKKGQDTKDYYDGIKTSAPALLVKVSDRCHNISSMAGAFSLGKMKDYVNETEEYVIPLCRHAKNYYPEYSDQIFCMKYHIESMNSTVKSFVSTIEQGIKANETELS